jgi:hypothetical protein
MLSQNNHINPNDVNNNNNKSLVDTNEILAKVDNSKDGINNKKDHNNNTSGIIFKIDLDNSNAKSSLLAEKSHHHHSPKRKSQPLGRSRKDSHKEKENKEKEIIEIKQETKENISNGSNDKISINESLISSLDFKLRELQNKEGKFIFTVTELVDYIASYNQAYLYIASYNQVFQNLKFSLVFTEKKFIFLKKNLIATYCQLASYFILNFFLKSYFCRTLSKSIIIITSLTTTTSNSTTTTTTSNSTTTTRTEIIPT